MRTKSAPDGFQILAWVSDDLDARQDHVMGKKNTKRDLKRAGLARCISIMLIFKDHPERISEEIGKSMGITNMFEVELYCEKAKDLMQERPEIAAIVREIQNKINS